MKLLAPVLALATLLAACGQEAARTSPSPSVVSATAPASPAASAAAQSPAAKPASSTAASAAQSAAAKSSGAPQAQGGAVKMEWLGWSHFRFTSPAGKVVLTNPFINGPDSPVKVNDITQADLILVPDGHGDEVGSTVDIAKNTGAKVMAPFELGTWFMEQGIPESQVVRSNPGSRLKVDGITVRMVGSVHGSGLPKPTAAVPYGGPAAGFMITFENGWTVYHSGSTAATSDQALWAQMYKPDAVILVMDAGKEPMDFAMEVKLLQTGNPNLKTVIPHHHRVTPLPGQTTAAEVQAAVQAMGLDVQVVRPVLRVESQFTK